MTQSFRFSYAGVSSKSSSSQIAMLESSKCILLWITAPVLSATTGRAFESFSFARWRMESTPTGTRDNEHSASHERFMNSAIAIAAHPDDIEFVMAGTLLRLKERGWEIHYFNLSTGNCGSVRHNAVTTRRL